jgi:catechol 2,3-dioxygenase-like lactoylglutathione lyase family enzyme
MSNTKASTAGIHHLGLTVADIQATRAFFVDALGFEQVGERPAYPAVFVSDGTVMLTLWQAEDPATAVPFDRRKGIGLHHFALRVEDLDDVYGRIAERDDVTVEFAPENLGDGPTRHMMCAIPGGIRVEFIAPA